MKKQAIDAYSARASLEKAREQLDEAAIAGLLFWAFSFSHYIAAPFCKARL